MTESKRHKFHIVAVGLIVLSAVLLSLFRHWEISGETWGYWLFARIFAQTGEFIIIDRSPLYILYLNLFRWIGYPGAVISEYIVTSLLAAISLIGLFKRHIGLFLAVLAAFLWIPFLQIAEPPLQSLALACICLAVAVRDKKTSRFRLALSYALFGCAYMFRPNYLIFVIIFAIGDGINFFRQKNLKSLRLNIRPRLAYFPILLIVVLLLWTSDLQSPHPWNNTWFSTTTWYPNRGKTLHDTLFAHAFTWHYIAHKYGTFKDKDFYFVQKEVFGDADTAIKSILANPGFIAMQTLRNVRFMFREVTNFTMVPVSPRKSFQSVFFYYLVALLVVCLVLAIFYGARRACKSRSMFLFFISGSLFIGSVALTMPRARYIQPIIPIFVLSAFWYGTQLRGILTRKQAPSGIKQQFFLLTGKLIVPFVFIFLSNGLSGWTEIIKDVAGDIKKGELKVLERRPYSLKASFKSLQFLLRNCDKGILSLENTFIGAFTDMPLDKIYDIWEIPPFGNFGDSQYKGLYPERIDCVFVSRALATDIGCATNLQIRYQSYIKPYVQQLKDQRAVIHDIKTYGQAIILPKKLGVK